MKLLDYIKGNRKGKEAHRIEKEAMNDSFLAEALEGFDGVGGDHAEIIERLSRKVAQRSTPGKKKRTLLIGMSAAAVLLLFLTIGGRYLLREQPEQIVPYLAEATDTAGPEDTTDASRSQSPVQVAQVLEQEQPQQSQQSQPQASETVTIILDQPVLPEENAAGTNDSEDVMIQPATVSADTQGQQNARIATPLSIVSSSETSIRGESTRMAAKSFAASGTVTGQVVDAQGLPLPGAAVTVRGTGAGTLADAEGNFQLEAGPDDILDIHSLGHEPSSVLSRALPGRIVLQESTSQLDEVMVIGYGSERHSGLTGSVAGLQAEQTRVSRRRADASRSSAGVQAEQTQQAPAEPYTGPEGGMTEFKKYVRENKAVLSDKDGNRITGEVVLEFRVNRHGRPAAIRIEKSLTPEADAEAKRLLEKGPDWEQSASRVQVTIEL